MTTPFPFVAGAVLQAAQLNDITNLPINDQTANYVLVAGDAGKRVIMNAAGSTTITVNNSVFTTGDTIFIANKGAGTCTITAGTATVNTSGSLALAQYGGGTLVALSASTFTFFPAGGIGYGTATGGSSSSITVSGVNYTLLTITTDTNLVVSKSGIFDCLLIGGGGGGGTTSTRASGGGGGGQVIGHTVVSTIYLAAATYAVDVGAGGAAGLIGVESDIGGIITAGGGGSGYNANASVTLASGGSMGGWGNGGGGYGAPYTTLNSSINSNIGGNLNGDNAAGGGGGAAGAGGTAPSATQGGTGGNGLDISAWITGATYYAGAGGAGGGSGTGGTAGNGGVAGKTSGTGNAGVNYGAGGGGSHSANGGSGAAGVVYVRFKV